MPASTGHGLAGLAIAYYFKKDRLGFREAVLCVLAANLPDGDYIPGILIGAWKRFHPSFTHSFFAAGVVALMVYWAAKKIFAPEDHRRWAWMLGAAYTSHLLLDIIQVDTYLANGIGIPLFYPITNQCYQMGWDWLPSVSHLLDFTSFSSVIRSILNLNMLRFLFHEQLVVGVMIGAAFGLRRVKGLYKKRLIDSHNL